MGWGSGTGGLIEEHSIAYLLYIMYNRIAIMFNWFETLERTEKFKEPILEAPLTLNSPGSGRVQKTHKFSKQHCHLHQSTKRIDHLGLPGSSTRHRDMSNNFSTLLSRHRSSYSVSVSTDIDTATLTKMCEMVLPSSTHNHHTMEWG